MVCFAYHHFFYDPRYYKSRNLMVRIVYRDNGVLYLPRYKEACRTCEEGAVVTSGCGLSRVYSGRRQKTMYCLISGDVFMSSLTMFRLY